MKSESVILRSEITDYTCMRKRIKVQQFSILNKSYILLLLSPNSDIIFLDNLRHFPIKVPERGVAIFPSFIFTHHYQTRDTYNR